jgi:hypothetical protein
MTRRTAAFLREEAVRQAAFALAAKRETNTLRAVLRAVLDKHGDECDVCADAVHVLEREK